MFHRERSAGVQQMSSNRFIPADFLFSFSPLSCRYLLFCEVEERFCSCLPKGKEDEKNPPKP